MDDNAAFPPCLEASLRIMSDGHLAWVTASTGDDDLELDQQSAAGACALYLETAVRHAPRGIILNTRA